MTSIDKTVKTNQLYTYRLRQVNQDGKENLSQKVVANIMDNAISLSVSPNPANDFATIAVTGVDESQLLRLVDARGQLLQNYPLGNNATINIDVKALATGIYFVQLPTTNDLLVKSNCLGQG